MYEHVRMHVCTCLRVHVRERVCGRAQVCERVCLWARGRARVSVSVCASMCACTRRRVARGGGSAAWSRFPLWRRPRVATGDPAPYKHFPTLTGRLHGRCSTRGRSLKKNSH